MYKPHRLSALAATMSLAGLMIIKDEGDDPKPGESEDFKALMEELGTVSTMLKETKEKADQQYKDLSTHFDGVKGDQGEIAAKVEEQTKRYAELIEKQQSLQATIDQIRKELDNPLHKGGKELEEADKEKAVELQRRIWVDKNPEKEATEFKPDMDNLVDMKTMRRVARKLLRVGIDKKEDIVRHFSDIETKHFEASGMDMGFFMPEILGIEIDCEIECWSLVDLYAAVSVSRSAFKYPRVNSYGDLGEYTCDASCDGPIGEEGNLQMLAGQTYDFRGVFCFQRKTLQEANYDLLDFMVRAAFRSYRINRNQALITGDGVNSPLGWLEADIFDKRTVAATEFDHQAYRMFLLTAPVEYGPVVATMHQNMFAYLASQLDNNKRFIFGDGNISFTPDDASERIRISNCLPDATDNNTLGTAGSPFIPGSFIAAAGNWTRAYTAVTKTPLNIMQYEGGSSKWCVKYQFDAEDSGFIGCSQAARILEVA